VTEEATRSPATSVYPTEAERSEASLLGLGRGIRGPWAVLSRVRRAPLSLNTFLSQTRRQARIVRQDGVLTVSL
jgi:hypothetical protein